MATKKKIYWTVESKDRILGPQGDKRVIIRRRGLDFVSFSRQAGVFVAEAMELISRELTSILTLSTVLSKYSPLFSGSLIKYLV